MFEKSLKSLDFIDFIYDNCSKRSYILVATESLLHEKGDIDDNNKSKQN